MEEIGMREEAVKYRKIKSCDERMRESLRNR